MSYHGKSFSRHRREQNPSDDEESDIETTSSEDEDGVVHSKDKKDHRHYYTPEKQKSRHSRDDDYDVLTEKAQNISLEENPEEFEECRLPVRLGWYGPNPVKQSPGKCKRQGLRDYIESRTGVDPRKKSGIYYLSHKGPKNRRCKAKKCHYVGQATDLEERISTHFNGNLEIDKCLKYDDESNHADDWDLKIWEVSEDELNDAEHDMIEKKGSLTPNGHNMKR